jgi:hypothetical protein
MKKDSNKTYLILSSVFGIIALILWILRFWYVNEINILFPLTANTFQLGFISFMGKE